MPVPTTTARRYGFSKNRLCLMGPLAPACIMYLCGLGVFFCFRCALAFKYFDRVTAVDDWMRIFWLGFRVDTITLCFLLFAPVLALIALPARAVARFRSVFALYFAFCLLLAVFLECATFPFMDEFDTRPDRIFIEHMVQVREVFGMVLKGYGGMLAAALAGTLAVGACIYRFMSGRVASIPAWAPKRRICLFVVAAVLLVAGTRQSFRRNPVSLPDFMFSKSHIVNQLCLNTTYNLMHEYVSQREAEKGFGEAYGSMEPADMFARVRRVSRIPEASCADPQIPLLHAHQPSLVRRKPVNLVMIVEESLGAEYVGSLGGMPLTPNLDRLSSQGLLFTRLYATGTRTLRGLEAVLSGFPPSPAKSVIKLSLAERNFFTIAELLRGLGYATGFFYGGKATFDNMQGFCLNNGFESVYDEKDIPEPLFKGNWGVSDEDLFRKANDVIASYGERPFFALILTTSNHDPFEFPDGRIQLYEQPKMTRHNAIKYADHALGTFFELAAGEAYYGNTVFLVVADHSTRLNGEDLVPIEKFHVPALLIGPDVNPGRYDTIASQIDLPSTLLDIMGISAETPLPGRSLLALGADAPGRAIIQYGEDHVYLEEDRAVIHRTGKAPEQFVYRESRLVPDVLDPELEQDALAHALLPGFVYSNMLHRLRDIQMLARH